MGAAHVGDRGEVRVGPLRVVVDDHVREVARRQRVVPLLRLGVDHADEVVVVEVDAGDRHHRQLQDPHERAVLGAPDDAAVGDDGLARRRASRGCARARRPPAIESGSGLSCVRMSARLWERAYSTSRSSFAFVGARSWRG